MLNFASFSLTIASKKLVISISMTFNTLKFQQLHIVCRLVGSLHCIRLCFSFCHFSVFTPRSLAVVVCRLGGTMASGSELSPEQTSRLSGRRLLCWSVQIHYSANMFRVLTIFDMSTDEVPATVDCNTLCDSRSLASGASTKYDNKINFFITRTCFSFDRNYFYFYFRFPPPFLCIVFRSKFNFLLFLSSSCSLNTQINLSL